MLQMPWIRSVMSPSPILTRSRHGSFPDHPDSVSLAGPFFLVFVSWRFGEQRDSDHANLFAKIGRLVTLDTKNH